MEPVEVLILSGFVGVLSSLAASGLFLFFLSRFRPKLDISPQIAKITDSNGQVKYSVKVINRTKKHVVNIKAIMYVRAPCNVPGGTIHVNTYLTLRTSDVLEIKRFDSKDRNADYAIRFVTFDDLEAIWSKEPSSVVEFHVYATHSLTGFGRVFSQPYHDMKNELRAGNFKYGNYLDVM